MLTALGEAPAGCDPRNGRADRLYLLPMFSNSYTEQQPADEVVAHSTVSSLMLTTQITSTVGLQKYCRPSQTLKPIFYLLSLYHFSL